MVRRDDRPDVLIAGAGPAGAAAAIALARVGARVLMVDRARFPRAKPCGDTLNPGALAALDTVGVRQDVEARGYALDGMVVTGANGQQVVAQYPNQHALAVRRDVLDALLVERAARAGVEVREGVRVVAPLVDTRATPVRVRGAVVSTARGNEAIEARWTIAADGRRSALAQPLGLSALASRPRRWAVRAYYGGVGGCDTRLGEMHVRRGHYVGVAPMGGGVVNVCAVTADRSRLARPREFIENVLAQDAQLRERFARAERLSDVSCVGPLAVCSRSAGMEGLALAGDAAGFVDPMTGDGLRFAMVGGLLAAHAIHASADHPIVPMHARLAAWRRRAFARKRWMNLGLRTLLSSSSGVQAAEYVAVVAPFVVRNLILAAADLPGIASQGMRG